ncbi:MAG: type II secretion system secretin GspD [Desulfobulbaceae bacterium]|nr:type II secretion system secretin GspD [Desulfobulbaceae bacterium]
MDRLLRLPFSILLLCILAAPLTVPSHTAAQEPERASDQYVTIDFNDVDINLFIKYISELTGRNFIVDRTVKGQVTIISPTRISVEDAYYVFQSVLEVHGFTTIPSGSVIKIVPSVQARSKNIATIREQGRMYPEDKIVTQLISLQHSDPEEVKKILAPLVSKTSVVIAHTDSGMLIITDYMSNINRLLEIISAVDIPSVGDELVVLPLEYASADAVSKSLTQIFQQQPAARGAARRQAVRILSYERTNSLIVLASKLDMQKIRDLLEKLDTEMQVGTGNIQVYYLQHANSEELLKVLTSLPSDAPVETTQQQQQGRARVQAPPISRDVKIMSDPETNSLIITAPREDYLVLEQVIKKLDIPRRMVYLEALIMEVSVGKSFDLGVQWGGGGTFSDDTGTVIGGFSGSQSAPFGNLRGITADPPVLPGGFSVGVLKQGVKIGNVFFPNLGAVLNAFKNDSDVEIIATPQILTSDNKQAEIKVGENVPYITSQNTTAALQDYTNYEYKDVTTTLNILPQINQSDLLRLEIGVEVIKLKDLNDDRPTTFKRTANTTVVVHNEETVVIGGIIGQDTTQNEFKVPLLGDIPGLGWLFKSRGNTQSKTNLFIFITPHIVENPAELASMYYQKRDVMEDVREGLSVIDEWGAREPSKTHAVALSDLGFINLRQDNLLRARQYFEQALKIDPDNPYALLNLGVVNEREGNIVTAAEMYGRVLELSPPEPDEDGMPAEAARQLRQLQQVAEEYLNNLSSDRNSVPVQPSIPVPDSPRL